MTDMLATPDTASDAELMSAVRAGDSASFGELFSRHIDAARKMARHSASATADADDLVAEAFSKVFAQLRAGVGPDIAFRAYLLTTIRRLHVDKVRVGARVQPTDDQATLDRGVAFRDSALAEFESGTAAAAFASLPERWQLVLWHLDVEGQKPAAVALLLGMSANSVSALAYRAREGLRQAYLQNHLNDTADESCRWTTEHLGAFVRNGLARRDQDKVKAHLGQCRRCTGVYLELADINSNLGALLGPAMLGAAAAGYLGTGSKLGFLVVPWGRVKEWVAGSATHAGIAVAGVVTVAAVATTLVYAIATTGDQDAVTSTERSSGDSGEVTEQPAELPGVAEPPDGGGDRPGSGSSSPTPPAQPGDPDALVPPVLAGPGPTTEPVTGPSPEAAGGSGSDADAENDGDGRDGDSDGRGGGDKKPGRPSAPTALSASVDGYEVRLGWEPVRGSGVRYEIYREDLGGVGDAGARRASTRAADPIATTARTRYVDEPEGGEYAYTVRAVRARERSKAAKAPRVQIAYATGRISITQLGVTKCLTANGDSVTVPIDNDCASPTQWSLYSDRTIRADGGCLTAPTTSGKSVYLAQCRGSVAQEWDFDPTSKDGQVVSSASSKGDVLDLEGLIGPDVIIHGANEGKNQLWTLPTR